MTSLEAAASAPAWAAENRPGTDAEAAGACHTAIPMTAATVATARFLGILPSIFILRETMVLRNFPTVSIQVSMT